ncbi:MFS transporter [Paraburkholderia fungorum]|jgi:MFS family permease|uniref:MFS family permease n=1 Tax=Paraburkholderia fungorum TaxID=134537 RepID=A0AAJ3VRP5_9BURK|nr:MFS transporter [Paraburkholderia fungorum]AJZ62449.1 major Facilitator Superfamily protein [Paraburkholderia fungorum]MBB4512563.1 MFS family permease [Paraburkholderia fungorum]MBB5539863.1 MFS family permease [Paraburkholderia fungorum]MBB6200469.1 MFS family permease [Paraburkholderia fungorum]MDT8836794.1 MFS transporter [Paraburkholderia fungorum]
MQPTYEASGIALPVATTASIYRKITWRLIPFLCLCYLAAYLDRINIGLAKLQMSVDLQFSETVYGLGAGLFFVGYVALEVPSNLLLHRFGARLWISRIMITWGALSMCTLLVTTPTQFYVVRFLLGAAEAGFLPGVLLYLTQWYPPDLRGRAVGLFLMGLPLASLIGNPLSGWIMGASAGVHGWTGWQWLFFLEGIPSIALGLLVLILLPRNAQAAAWLTASEKDALRADLERHPPMLKHEGAGPALRNGYVWVLSLINMTLALIIYVIGFWLPTIIRESGVQGSLRIGLLTAIPSLAAILLMLVLATRSDKHRERRWHLIIPLFTAGVCIAIAARFLDNTFITLALLTVANACIFASFPVFWAIPGSLLKGRAAAAGIALINSVANLGGFFATFLIGWIKDATHSVSAGLVVFAGLAMLGCLLTFLLPARITNR